MLHFLDVGASREGLGGARQHDRGNSGVSLQGIERLIERYHQFGVDGVQRLRAVEPNQPNLLMGFDENRVTCHARGPFLLCALRLLRFVTLFDLSS